MVVSASRNLSERLRAGGLARTVTIPMGVEPGIFSPQLRDDALRSRLLSRCGLPPEATLLVGLGRLAPEKRWPMVIDAVTAAGIDHPIGFLLIGDGRERASIVRATKHNPHVQLLASITDRRAVARILASADALVHGCEAETFCMVVSEARASGLPLIVPDAGGASDQFQRGQGATYHAANASSLAAALKGFVARDPGDQRVRAAAAAAAVRSMDQHFHDLFRAYERSAGSRRLAC
jgi:alpha-1,6-mannosyltransferase